MKNAIIILVGVALLTTFSQQATAQYNSGSMWGYTYDISIPMGQLGDFNSDASFRGMTIQGRGFVSSQFSIGGSIGWHVFNDVTEETSEFMFTAKDLDTEMEIDVQGALSGTQYRYTNSFPIMVTGHYYTADPGFNSFSLFGGLGIGTSIVSRRIEIGLIAVEESVWHFALAPEVGFVWGLNPDVKLLASARYLVNFENNKAESASYLNFQVGLATGFY